MSEAARVTSIQAVKEWREAVCVFKDDAADALVAVDLEVRRTEDWVHHQLKFWEAEVRRREDLLVQARNDLVRRKMQVTPAGREPDTTEQQKALRKAQARLQQAEEMVVRCRQWAIKLRQEVEEYQGFGRHLAGMLEGDLARAVNLLERKLDTLDAYLATTAPRTPKAEEKK